MSNEDFLKAAADRAQVGSSAEVAQKAKRDILVIKEVWLGKESKIVWLSEEGNYVIDTANVTFCRDSSGRMVSFIEQKSPSMDGESLADELMAKYDDDRAEIVDGNP